MIYKQFKEGNETDFHLSYKEYFRKTIQGEFDPGDTIEIKVNGKVIYSYTPQYDNAVFNFVVQDKGRAPTDQELLDMRIELLRKESLSQR